MLVSYMISRLPALTQVCQEEDGSEAEQPELELVLQ